MTLQTLATIVFFLSAGINYLVPQRVLAIIAGVSGILLGILLLLPLA